MTLPSVHARGKRKQTGLFDYDEDEERVEEISKELLRKFDSPETKTKTKTKTSSPINKYTFLQVFAQDAGIESKESDHGVTEIEGKGKVSKNDERSKCELRERGTGDMISVISDDSHGRIRISSSTTSSLSENDDVSTEEEAMNSASDLHEVDSRDSQVLLTPDVIIYGDLYCTDTRLTFSSSSMNVESSSVNGTKKTFRCQWRIEDIIKVESQWCLEVETAFVNVLLKSRNPKRVDSAEEICGIDLLKFSVYDPKWSEEVDTIKLLDSSYKDIWFDTITESEESACSGLSLGRSLTNLANSFEDLIYPQGDPDAVVVRKQDIELLKPRRFINDTIIDFYIKYLKSRIPPEDSGRFHFFNCFFFRKLANLDKGSPSIFGGREAYQRVQKWTKNVNLFEKDYIFIPINCSFHWSLIIICHPGESVPSHVKNPPRVPCILHLDSIRGSHRGVINIFQSYLREEWKARHGDIATDLLRAPDMQIISLELPQQGNSFDCGLFLLHYLDLFVAQAPPTFNPSLITRSTKFLTRNWFPAKEASQKRKNILELLYRLHKGHNPSILPINPKSKPPDCEVSNEDDQEKETKNVIEICNSRKPSDSSSSDLILTKEVFYSGGYDPTSPKRRKVFMSPIVEEVQDSSEKENHSPVDIRDESVGQERITLQKDKCVLYIEDSGEKEKQFPTDIKDESIGQERKTLQKDVLYIEDSGEKEKHIRLDTQDESFGQEKKSLQKDECMLCIEDSDDEDTVSVEYVPDSQDSDEVETKDDDDDELLLVIKDSEEKHKTRDNCGKPTGMGRNLRRVAPLLKKGIKSDAPSIAKRVHKTRYSTTPSLNNIYVLSDDESSDVLKDVGNLLIPKS